MNTMDAHSVILSQIEPDQARIVTYFRLLGPFGVTIVLTAVVSFVFAAIILWRGKGSFAAAALILVTFAPLMVGLASGLNLAMQALLNIAQFHMMDTDQKMDLPPLEHYMLALDAISPISIALFLSAPTYMLSTLGAFVKSLRKAPMSESP